MRLCDGEGKALGACVASLGSGCHTGGGYSSLAGGSRWLGEENAKETAGLCDRWDGMDGMGMAGWMDGY